MNKKVMATMVKMAAQTMYTTFDNYISKYGHDFNKEEMVFLTDCKMKAFDVGYRIDLEKYSIKGIETVSEELNEKYNKAWSIVSDRWFEEYIKEKELYKNVE